MASPDELMRSVHNFHAAADRMRRPGVSWIAEVAQLKILVGKYPDHAREFLARLGEPVPGGGCPVGTTTEQGRA
ncbi:hypothetical protein [Actinoallomurus rhizosphaericola]|uniref:hypothetical protein n=1 Tax=Actinoallomurus rhizosphaericola TaxID=2952536 RepID=UPI002090AA9D|nr:hypothetical protein [Actinoallomurus rhizosphaericola]MCO5994558.1 hypothetical protein [Actinoallomurus rhizosphaericola]